jgi:hypothetical protein
VFHTEEIDTYPERIKQPLKHHICSCQGDSSHLPSLPALVEEPWASVCTSISSQGQLWYLLSGCCEEEAVVTVPGQFGTGYSISDSSYNNF